MEPNMFLGLAVVIGIILCLRSWLRGRRQPWQRGEPGKCQGLSAGTNAEKAIRKEGFIGGSRFNAPRGFETAYHRIMAGVQVDSGIKSGLHEALAQKQCAETCEKFLHPGQWEWPEFDRWKEIFLDDGKFPYMWAKYPEICMKSIDDFPLCTAFERTPVKDIKTLFQQLQIAIPPKIKKAELLELAGQKITIKVLQEQCPDTYLLVKNEFDNRVNHGKCAILEHTITMLTYHLRDFYTNKRLKIDAIKGCPVEEKYAKGKGKISEDNIPPFFPGDRTGVISIKK